MKISYKGLYREHPDCRTIISTRTWLPKRKLDRRAQEILTRCCLDFVFGFKNWWIPDGNLVPAFSGRCGYIEAVKAKLESFGVQKFDDVLWLDIGTGYSGIFGFIIAGMNLGAVMGIDNDESAILHLGRLRKPNAFEVAHTDGSLFKRCRENDERYHISICNPPFYDSIDDMNNNSFLDTARGSPSELVYPGGDLGFVSEMIKESTAEDKNGPCIIYSSLIARAKSVPYIKALLRSLQCVQYFEVVELKVGYTRRWIVFWSMHSDETLQLILNGCK